MSNSGKFLVYYGVDSFGFITQNESGEILAPFLHLHTRYDIGENVMKICTKCKKTKPLSEFYKSSKKNRLESKCKACHNLLAKIYRTTKAGLVTRIYGAQKRSSGKRGHIMPAYTNCELQGWVFSQPNFNQLFNNWKASNYETNLSPSCNRLDDYKPYTLDNLELITWQENNKKHWADRKNGINNKHNKAVLQYTKDGVFIMEYYSMSDASRQTKTHVSGISKCCLHERDSANGYLWEAV